jgi:integrase
MAPRIPHGRRNPAAADPADPADNLWRETGNLLLAQQLLRHSSVATTQDYLHPTRDDLAAGLAKMQVVRSDETDLA